MTIGLNPSKRPFACWFTLGVFLFRPKTLMNMSTMTISIGQVPPMVQMGSGLQCCRKATPMLMPKMKMLSMEWHPSPTPATPKLGSMVKRMDQPASLQKRSDILLGPSSNISFLRHLSAATSFTLKSVGDSLFPSDQPPTRSLISRAPSPVNTPSVTSPDDRSQVDALALPPNSQADRLIELFFSETGLLFPFVQKRYVMATFDAAKTRLFSRMHKSFLCLLNAIFAISAHIDDHPETSPSDAETFFQRSNVLLSQVDPRMNNVETGMCAYPHLIDSCKLTRSGTVQSLLLLIQYRQGTNKSDDTWVLLGKAVRIALQLGLHSKSGTVNMSHVEVETRKRIWYGIVTLDRVLSMTFGRPQTISEQYVKLDLPINRSLDSLAAPMELMTPQSNSDPHETVCFFTATM